MTPDPEPTPTGFADEATARSAAEATVDAYVEALNQIDLSDPMTFELLYATTTGEANAGARETFSKYHADGLTASGTTTLPVSVVTELRMGLPSAAKVAICLDVSNVEVRTPSGESAVSPDRPDVQSMELSLEGHEDSPTGWRIALISGREGEPKCAD